MPVDVVDVEWLVFYIKTKHRKSMLDADSVVGVHL